MQLLQVIGTEYYVKDKRSRKEQIMHHALSQAVEDYKIARKLLYYDRLKIIAMLPENVQSEYHYNGLNGIKNTCATYYELIKAID